MTPCCGHHSKLSPTVQHKINKYLLYVINQLLGTLQQNTAVIPAELCSIAAALLGFRVQHIFSDANTVRTCHQSSTHTELRLSCYIV